MVCIYIDINKNLLRTLVQLFAVIHPKTSTFNSLFAQMFILCSWSSCLLSFIHININIYRFTSCFAFCSFSVHGSVVGCYLFVDINIYLTSAYLCSFSVHGLVVCGHLSIENIYFGSVCSVCLK